MRVGLESGCRGLQNLPSRPAFHNALCRLEPGRQPIGASLAPPWRHRSEPPLLALALETEPARAVLACDGDTSSEWPSPAIRGMPSVFFAAVFSCASRRHSAVHPSSLGRGRCDEPHLPPSSHCVKKRTITHRQFLRRRFAPRSELSVKSLHGGCQKRRNPPPDFTFPNEYRAFCQLPDCRSS
jgi:hypothetical protein